MKDNSVSIYLHYPFCDKKCPYCDFNSYVMKKVNEEDLLKAYIKSLDYYKSITNYDSVKTIFFGGGTPSIASINFLETIINHIKSLWNVSSDLEVSIEMNPASSVEKKIAIYKKIGINRISIGVQSLDNNELKFLGRLHSVKDALNTIGTVQKYFDNLSADFIYSLPEDTLDTNSKKLEQIVNLNLPHYSLYQLTIEPNTIFGKNPPPIPQEELSLKLFNQTRNFMVDKKTPHYEISNYAKKGFECKHNLSYWDGSDFIGIGAGAHGRISHINGSRYAIEDVKNPIKWTKNPVEIDTFEKLTNQDIKEELIITALRKTDGLLLENFKVKTGYNLENFINIDKIKQLSDFIKLDKKNLYLTDKGFPLVNKIIEEIIY